ncbi:MAG TPA: FtsQ-type POTRA domain-containing protein [Propionibacteriaceae bacterium]|nr:FtsQ-type POTRA domain-containing protein [Propionibacteriaceae bacterium]
MAERARTVDASVRLAARRRERLRRRVLRLGAVIGVLVVLVAAAWLVYLSPVFAVTTVTVTGTSVLTPESVREAGKVPLGTPLARLDTGAVRSRVAQLKPVAQVAVTRSLPHTVKIAVTERTAVYALSAGTGFDLVDSAGVDFTSVPDAPKGLVVATITGDDERLRRDVATIVTSLPQAVRDRAVLVTAKTPDSIVIDLNGGTEVVWGSAESSSQKAQVLAALLSVKAGVYDVSSPSHPTTKS